MFAGFMVMFLKLSAFRNFAYLKNQTARFSLKKLYLQNLFIKISLKETGAYSMLMLFTWSKSKKISLKQRTLQLLLLRHVTADFLN